MSLCSLLSVINKDQTTLNILPLKSKKTHFKLWWVKLLKQQKRKFGRVKTTEYKIWIKGVLWLCIFIVSLSTESSLSISTFTHSDTKVPRYPLSLCLCVSLCLCFSLSLSVVSSFHPFSIWVLLFFPLFIIQFRFIQLYFLHLSPPSFLLSFFSQQLNPQLFYLEKLPFWALVSPQINKSVLWWEARTSLF